MPLDETQAPCLLRRRAARVLFAALKDGISDIYSLDLESGKVENLTQDEYADNDPQVSPDGRMVVYERRVSGNDKLYAFPLADPSHKTQLTFGPFDDAAPIFSTDGNAALLRLGRGRRHPEPAQPRPAHRRHRSSTRTSSAAPWRRRRSRRRAATAWPSSPTTRASTGCTRRTPPSRSRRSTRRCRPPPRASSTSSPTCRTRWCPRTSAGRSSFEGLYLEGRPPINVGVTSSGDFFGGTPVALTDVLGDQLFAFTVLSVSLATASTTAATRTSRAACTTASTSSTRPTSSTRTTRTTRSYYGQDPRDLAIATQRFTGGQVFAEYPLDTFRRLEFGVGVAKVEEQYGDQQVRAARSASSAAIAGLPCFVNNGWQAPDLAAPGAGDDPLRASSDRSPAAPSRWASPRRPPIGSFLQRTTVDADLRKYLRLGSTTRAARPARPRLLLDRRQPRLLLLRRQHGAAGLSSTCSFAGNQGFFANAELRLPLIHLAADADRHPGPAAGHDVLRDRRRPLQGRSPTSSATSDPGFSYVEDPIFGDAGARAGACRTAAPPGASACSSSSSATRCTSTGRSYTDFADDQPGLGLQLLDRVRLLAGARGVLSPPMARSSRVSWSSSRYGLVAPHAADSASSPSSRIR